MAVTLVCHWLALADLRVGKKAKKDTTATKAGGGANKQATTMNDKEAAAATSPEPGSASVTDAQGGSGNRKQKERDISSIL